MILLHLRLVRGREVGCNRACDAEYIESDFKNDILNNIENKTENHISKVDNINICLY